jgi:hypothetical protein
MAAGQGFKTFTTGEVLTAGDVNGYLMQGVLVFASEAARNAAITSPQEGQFAYTKDNNSLWYYTGSAWAASGATGDIEGVTAGVGISGGGTSGTVTITNSMATEITASGDIIVGTGSGTFDNLPIGTTGQLLTADTTVSPYKVKWASPAAAASGLTLITAQSFTAASTVNVNNCFSSTYQNYLFEIVISTTSSGGNADMRMRVGGVDASGSDYKWAVLTNNTSPSAAGAIANASATSFNDSFLGWSTGGNVVMAATIFCPNQAAPTLITSHSVSEPFATYLYNFVRAGKHTLATAYDGFSLIVTSGTMTGNLRVYGLAN